MKVLSLVILALPTLLIGIANANERNTGSISCATIVNNGWRRMPDIADYVREKQNSDKLGYGSECHIGSLVFAQCFIEPRWSVKQAVDELINKAIAGESLPGERVCGA
jgi:hypothetical protein